MICLRLVMDSAALKMKFSRICWTRSLEQGTSGRAGARSRVTCTSRRNRSPSSLTVSSRTALRSHGGRLVAGLAAEAEHGFDDAGALLDDGLDAVHARADLLGIVQVVLDDLGGAFDDGEDVVEVMGDAGGERAQGVHLLAVQQFAVGDFQFPRALGDFLLHLGVAAEQLPVAVEGQAGEEERHGQPGKGNQHQARLLVPGQDTANSSRAGLGSTLQLRSMARTWK